MSEQGNMPEVFSAKISSMRKVGFSVVRRVEDLSLEYWEHSSWGLCV